MLSWLPRHVLVSFLALSQAFAQPVVQAIADQSGRHTDHSTTTGSLHPAYRSSMLVNTAPTVTMLSPTPGLSYHQGKRATITARAIDAQDGNLSAELTWRSSRDGLLGTGATIAVGTLSAGTHTITASVRDRGGISATAMTTVTIVAATNVLIGAGDIASCLSSGDEATATLLDQIPGTIVTLGDNVYPDGTADQFAQCYGPSWGRHKARTMPAPGNHDYHTTNANGYYGYFGAVAGDPAKGYYSFSQNGWHIVMLNSEIDTSAGSAQEQWLRADLAANNVPCTLAVMHKPRFSSGTLHGSSTSVAALWEALYEYRADIVLSGHEHFYERFGPQDPDGNADPELGIREFVVGTGGASQDGYSFTDPPLANSEVRNNTAWGIIKLTLNATSYTWEFVPVAGKTFTDSGSGNCVTSSGPPALRQDVRIAASSDDAEEDSATNVSLLSSDLDMYIDGGTNPTVLSPRSYLPLIAAPVPGVAMSSLATPAHARVEPANQTAPSQAQQAVAINQAIGLRFTGITIPAGATIVNAYLQFSVDEINSEATYITIRGQAADNAATFATVSQNITSRPLTKASVQWTPVTWNTVGTAGTSQRTTNIAPIIREILSRPGWQSGNALALILTGTGHRVAVSYDGKAAAAPMLRIEYRLPATAMRPQQSPKRSMSFSPGMNIALLTSRSRRAHLFYSYVQNI